VKILVHGEGLWTQAQRKKLVRVLSLYVQGIPIHGCHPNTRAPAGYVVAGLDPPGGVVRLGPSLAVNDLSPLFRDQSTATLGVAVTVSLWQLKAMVQN
jgi:hypothetical protein